MINLAKRLWDSPTVTSWVNQGAQAARLLLVLPLVLVRFSEEEVAAFLLFSSLVFFSNVISTQTGFVFSRLIALAMGGATDLSPYRPNENKQSLGSPNWDLIKRIYRTAWTINLGLAGFGVLITAGVGYFSLEKLVENSTKAGEIWIAFSVLLLGNFLADGFRRYALTLRGLNQVALTNRWDALFSLLSSGAGALVLAFGAGIVGLVVVLQSFAVIGVLRMAYLLYVVAEPRFLDMRGFAADRQIIHWAWTPLWRGLIQVLANSGAVKVCILILARHADAQTLSSVLLIMRILETGSSMAIAPLGSKAPKFGRMLGEGKIKDFANGVSNALRHAVWLYVITIVAIGWLLPPFLDCVNSSVGFIEKEAYILLSICFFLGGAIRLCLMISTIGNNIIMVDRMAAAAITSIALAALLIPKLPLYGFIMSSFLPVIIIANIGPYLVGCRLMSVNYDQLAARLYVLPSVFLLVHLTAYYYMYSSIAITP